MRTWVYNPHTGGRSIPPGVKARTERRILDYAAKQYRGEVLHLLARRVNSGSSGSEIPRRISAGFATSETKIDGVSPDTPTPMKSTNRAF
jgi:hypothetical protein